jgi:hypothetical protein
MHRKPIMLMLLALILLAPALALAPTPAQAQSFTIPVTAPQFTGTLAITDFAVQGNQIVAVGTLSGILQGVGRVVTQITLPVALSSPAAACDILHLELGPLDVDLLGLVIHLDRIVLDIDAQPGPGNLLGNLLCAITGLLDAPSPNLNQIVRLLQQLLALLG